ncbi:NAD-dependent epimerase/dehydratase family protein [Conexibacter sp. JD483]|uniref:NAD-dependent epimerase/dehydratase family protein n=1 Tax=unclassified Conexibacter TaxID=2627773 RepID=UPI00272440D9|nr:MULTISPECIES: NAD-dependent epimerase/dehydratase family protein [unclassified Conexibacter]MDO8187839.1 NAD-dependent epimerase/dehydratase family protein [Conexibacter sp. CPCC 205706]MDO8199952.1 NAD-dependent epimerase/dehydratase family protein [Conexibacter sp. CPCC 205762]MDR9369479.1 NAD-dependent epimerase/dehydratase family protein [Conexibacter sp. JD483]
MRVLVTGGAGFIGSHVLDSAAAAGLTPCCFDRRASPFHPPGEIETVLGDLLDPAQLRAAMEGCDAVVHLAASADVGAVVREPAAAERLNASGTLCVLEAARAAGVAHVVYASTIWVYSDCAAEQVDEREQLGLPGHLYTATKLAGEMYCRSYAELYGLRTTILRFGIPYGPRARAAAVVPSMVERALGGEPLTIAGDGAQSRRFVYVEDLADGVVRALERPGDGCRVYNLVGDRDVSIRAVAETVCEVVGDGEITYVPARAADFGGVAVSGERAADELGWRPQTSFEEGVRRYVAWRLEQQQEEPALAPARLGARLLSATVRLAVPLLLMTALLGTLVAYLLVVGTVDVDLEPGASVLTIAAVLTLAGALTLETGRRLRGVLLHGLWIVAATYLLSLALPWTRHRFGISRGDALTVLVGLSGAALAVALTALVQGVRHRRAAAPAAAPGD